MRYLGFHDKSMINFTFEKDDKSNPNLSLTAKKYVENFPNMIESGKGLLLFGNVGSGKTFICIVYRNISKTSFRNVVDLRQMSNKELKKFSKEDRIEILKQKKYFAIKKTLNNKFTEEQTKSIDKFDKLVGIY